jgi:YggT family protein
MLVIAQAYWFFSKAVQLIIVAIVVLMILRLIIDAADLNPFGWASRTLHRLTDPLVIPVRGALRNVGIDPKFGPLVVILVSILLGYFLLQILATIATTIEGVVSGLLTGAIVAVVGFIISGLISLYILFIFMRVIFSWGMVSYRNRVMRFLYDVTEPLLGPLRRMLPTLGQMDISPLVAILILWLFQAAIAGTLLRGATPMAF